MASGGIPDVIEQKNISKANTEDNRVQLGRLLVLAGITTSNGEARRLITQNGVKVNGQVVADPFSPIDLSAPVTIQKGKNFFMRIGLGD